MELFSEARVEPREYQHKAVTKILEAFEQKKKALLIMATGTGKTIVFSEVIRHFLKRRVKSAVLAHRDELLNQAKSKIARQTGYSAAKEKANEYAELSDMVVVASMQSLRNDRLLRWPRDHFSFVCIDEAHHATSKTYKSIIEHFQSDLLGVTATPDRADEKQLGDIFNTVAFEYPLHQAIKDNNLCRIVGRRITDFEIDLSELRITAGDFNDEELGRLIEKYVAPIAVNIKNETASRHTMVFLPSVDSAQMMSKALNDIGISAAFVSGRMTKEERDDTLYKFSKRIYTHLCSCDLLLEGYDEPSVDAIVMCRPTGSRAVFSQAVGRGTRLFPGKNEVLLIEFTYNSDKLRLVTAYELFSTAGYGERVQEAAYKSSLKSDYVDFLASLEEEKKKFFRTDEIIKRLPVKNYNFIEFDPLSLGDLLNVDVTKEFDITYQGRKLNGPATEKQIELLKRYNIANVNKLSKAQASALLDSIFQHGFTPMKGLASDSQKMYLRRLGMPLRDEMITKAQAGMLITLMKQKQGVRA